MTKTKVVTPLNGESAQEYSVRNDLRLCSTWQGVLFELDIEPVDDDDNECYLQLLSLSKGKTPQPQPQSNDLATIIAAAINPLLKQQEATISEEQIIGLIKRYGTAKEVNITVGELPTVNIKGLVHNVFESIIEHAYCRQNIYLVGASGSGKSHICKQVAESLALEFSAISVGQQTTKNEFFGYMGVNGTYVTTEFRKRYELGGVFLIDEIDAGNAGVLTSINSATSNGFCSFPDGMVKKHDDFICVAAANTFGNGANKMFVGRNVLDGATKNRFIFINMDYDKQLELSLYPKFAPIFHKIRECLKNEQVIISTRNIKDAEIFHSKFSAKYSQKEIVEKIIFAGIDSKYIAMCETILKARK